MSKFEVGQSAMNLEQTSPKGGRLEGLKDNADQAFVSFEDDVKETTEKAKETNRYLGEQVKKTQDALKDSLPQSSDVEKKAEEGKRQIKKIASWGTHDVPQPDSNPSSPIAAKMGDMKNKTKETLDKMGSQVKKTFSWKQGEGEEPGFLQKGANKVKTLVGGGDSSNPGSPRSPTTAIKNFGNKYFKGSNGEPAAAKQMVNRAWQPVKNCMSSPAVH